MVVVLFDSWLVTCMNGNSSGDDRLDSLWTTSVLLKLGASAALVVAGRATGVLDGGSARGVETDCGAVAVGTGTTTTPAPVSVGWATTDVDVVASPSSGPRIGRPEETPRRGPRRPAILVL